MDEFTLRKLKEITDISEFIEYINPYYPGLDIKEYSIEEIEKTLSRFYIKLIGKIIYYSPVGLRRFLQDFLLKYEIRNVKRIILSSIVGIPLTEKEKKDILFVEKYLDNTDFIKNLLEISSLDEIQLYMRGTKYYRIVREGIHFFNKNNEIFILDAFLDQLYYKNLVEKKNKFPKKEKKMIYTFIDYITEIYNLNVIFRGIKNNIDKNILSQLIVKNYFFMDKKEIESLIKLNNIDDFISKINDYFKRVKEIRSLYQQFTIYENNFLKSIEQIYYNYYFKKFQIMISDIDSITIFKILEILIKKEKEIRFNILPNINKILQEKFRILELFT